MLSREVAAVQTPAIQTTLREGPVKTASSSTSLCTEEIAAITLVTQMGPVEEIISEVVGG